MSNFEREVLCCILLDNQLIYQAVSKLSDDDFTDFRNASIFRALKKILIEEKSDGVDIALLRSIVNFEDSANLSCRGSIIPSLHQQTFNRYIEKVKENSTRRALYRHFLTSSEEIKKLGKVNFKEWLNEKESQFTIILNNFRKDVVKDLFNPKAIHSENEILVQTISGKSEQVVGGLRPDSGC